MNVVTREEFILAQKCPSVYVGSGLDVVMLFENGAQWKWDRGTEPPPEDSADWLHLQLQFYRTQLDSMERNYYTSKSNIETQASFHSMGAGPAPPPGAAEYLTTLVENILAKREVVEKLVAQLAELPQFQRADEYGEYRERQRNTAQEIFHELATVPQLPPR